MEQSLTGTSSIGHTGNRSSLVSAENHSKNIASVNAGSTTESAHYSEDNSPEGQGTSHQAIGVKITDEMMFRKFYHIGNENLITKSGRRLFPALMVNVQGLEADTLYNVAFRVASADPYRYRFANKKWEIVGVSEVDQNVDRQISLHPNSPMTGISWMKRPISFKNIKLTHNPKAKTELILLHSMHKYVVQIVFTANPGSKTAHDTVVPLKCTTFVAVISYQNFYLIDLKIANNPYASCSKVKLQRELEQDSTSRFTTFPCYNPYLLQMTNPRAGMTPPFSPSAPNLPTYKPLPPNGASVPPLSPSGASTVLTSSSFGVPVPPLPVPGTSSVLTSSCFGVPIPPLTLPVTSSFPVPSLSAYNPQSAFGIPVHLPGRTTTMPTSLSSAPNLPMFNNLPIPPCPPFYHNPRYPSLYPPFSLSPPPLGSIMTVTTESKTAPSTNTEVSQQWL